ncbi:hypothetical protein RhiirA1_522142 [Rhizophagus irregularis]|uniref:Uncharacterized protein n=1 Tax=Rhizophagus irregularis TaxID=588596 RepID=A0A2N0RGC3_9GLOM|nr:hypothetical protein RhiirA1_522142 [Rhizophagus irregularis]
MKQQLTRFGIQKVILKRLENVESANRSWFEEAKSHFTIKENNNLEINKTSKLEESKVTSSILFTSSKLHNFENFPEPRNATEAFYSKSYDEFYIPDSINEFAKSSSSKNNSMSKKISSIFKVHLLMDNLSG